MLKNEVKFIVGAPCAGKSWLCSRLGEKFTYIPHDFYKNHDLYWQAIVRIDETSEKPLLIESPFSVSTLKASLDVHRAKYEIVFVDVEPELARERYLIREHKIIPQGHLTRIQTYRTRAKEMSCFIGDSAKVLDYLLTK